MKFETQSIQLDENAMAVAREQFASAALDDEATCKVIADVYHKTGYLLDPHSATGVGAAKLCRNSDKETIISLATAHPVKFDAAIKAADIGVEPVIPEHMADIFSREERFAVMPAEQKQVADFITQKLAEKK